MSNYYRYLTNLPGWRTNRKIVVIESDDWGSIRMSSNESLKRLEMKGYQFDYYNHFDALESNEDLEYLAETLNCHKDSTNRPPVITGLNVVANPDFDKIEDNGFSRYEFESANETYQKYPHHDRVEGIWRKSIRERLIVPQFHGREHLNVQFWMRDLQEKKKYTLEAFENRITGIPPIYKGTPIRDYQAAFAIEGITDVELQKSIIEEGVQLFTRMHGYIPRYFIPTNGPFSTLLEPIVYKTGIRYLGTGKMNVEPLGDGKYKRNFRYVGMKGKSGLLYLTRNAFFEPSVPGKDWVNSCLKEIEIAFLLNKPVVISSHRVNYIGWLNEGNRDNGLRKLNELLDKIISKWPEVEFLTSVELGEAIQQSKNG